MNAPLVLCACGKPAAWFNHSTRLNLCDDCNNGCNEPLQQSLRLPLSPRVVDRARHRRDALEGDNWTEARWLATLEAVEKERDSWQEAASREVFAGAAVERARREERDALRAAVRAHLANLDTCSICGAIATTKSRADFYHCDKHTREEDRALFGARQVRDLLALLPPEAP